MSAANEASDAEAEMAERSAHRLSTIAGADRILVIEDGRLVEQGRHDELLARAGRYRALWDAQLAVKAWRPRTADADVRA